MNWKFWKKEETNYKKKIVINGNTYLIDELVNNSDCIKLLIQPYLCVRLSPPDVLYMDEKKMKKIIKKELQIMIKSLK